MIARTPYTGTIGPAGGAVAPSPLDFFTNIWAWYDTPQETGFSNDDPMPQWTDWSGNGRHAVQATVNRQPLYQTGQVNGLPAARFTGNPFAGTQKRFGLPNMSALTAGHFFIVIKMDADGSDSGGANNGPWNVTTDTINDVYFSYSVDGQIYDSWGSSTRKGFTKSGIALNQWNGYEVQSASGLWKAVLRGTEIHSTGTNTVGFNASPEIGRTLFDRYAIFSAATVVICSSIQDLTARTAWKTYANNRYSSVID